MLAHKDLLACDFAISADGRQISATQPGEAACPESGALGKGSRPAPSPADPIGLRESQGRASMHAGILLGMRGAVALEVVVTALKADVHSGEAGAASRHVPCRCPVPSAGVGGRNSSKQQAVTRSTDMICSFRLLAAGQAGGAVQNPLRAMSQLLASMFHDNSSVAVAGYYDR